MSRFSGRRGKGARKRAKEQRRIEAIARQQTNMDRGYYLALHERGEPFRCTPAPVEEFMPKPREES